MNTYTLENTEALVALIRDLCFEKGHSPREIMAWSNSEDYAVIGNLSGYNGPWDEPEDIAHILSHGNGVGEIEVFGAEPVAFVVSHWEPQILDRKVVA